MAVSRDVCRGIAFGEGTDYTWMMALEGSEFIGRTAVITGAAAGIGRALAIGLARRGADLVLADIDEGALARTAGEAARRGRRVVAILADIASPEAIAALASRALAELGVIDYLFNNAGVAIVAPVATMTTTDWQSLVDINLWGTVRLTCALLPHMLRRGRGHIVINASVAGLVGAPGMAGYSLTKFALVGFAESLRLETASQGVDVTVACPGYVRTNLFTSSRRPGTFRDRLASAPRWYGLSSEQAGERILRGVAAREDTIVLGPERLGWYAKRIAPVALARLVSYLVGRVGLAPSGVDREAGA